MTDKAGFKHLKIESTYEALETHSFVTSHSSTYGTFLSFLAANEVVEKNFIKISLKPCKEGTKFGRN